MFGWSLAGCASGSADPAGERNAQGAWVERGDWDDLDAAVEVGAGQAECAIVGSPRIVSESERIYALKHIAGTRLVLTARRADAASDADLPITLDCEAGPIRDTALENRVIARTAARLRELRGVDFAPIRE